MKKIFPRTKMIDEAKAGLIKNYSPEGEPEKPRGHIFIVEILIFVLVFFIIEILASLPLLPSQTKALMSSDEYIALTQQLQNGEISVSEYSQAVSSIDYMDSNLMLYSLLTTGVITILVIIFCRFIEKRKISSMGFRKNGAVKEYLVGMAIGIGIFSAAVVICLATGGLKFDGLAQNINFGMIGLFLIGYLIQGMSEETMFRGYFMVSLSRRSPAAVAIILSSIAFGCAHLGNPGVNLLGIINVGLFGMFAAVYILKRGNIWGACAIHSLWNFVQGNIYGIKVSGLTNMDTVFKMTSVEGKELINGGAFGLEGGIAVTIVLVIGIVIVLLTKTKQSELAEAVA